MKDISSTAPSVPATAFHRQLARAKQHQLSAEPGFNYLPGILSLVTAPIDLIYQGRALKAAVSIGDLEARKETILRIQQDLIGFTGALSTTCVYLKNLEWLPPWLEIAPVYCSASGLGLLLCALETMREICHLKRQVSFSQRKDLELMEHLRKVGDHLPDQLEKLKEFIVKNRGFFDEKLGEGRVNDLLSLYQDLETTQYKTLQSVYGTRVQWQTMQLALDTLHKDYLGEAKTDCSKRMQLERRIMPWCSDMVEKEVRVARKSFEQGTDQERLEAVKKGYELIQCIQIQSRKKMIMHLVSFLAIALTVACIATSLAGFPYVPLVLFGLGLGVGCLRYLLVHGWLNANGWSSFDTSNCIPEWVKKLSHKIHDIGAALATAITPSFSNRKVAHLA